MKKLLTVAFLFLSLFAQASYLSGRAQSGNGVTNTVQVTFLLTTPGVVGGHVNYRQRKNVTMTNGYFSPLWFDPGYWTVTIDVFPDTYWMPVPNDSNSYDWTMLITNKPPNPNPSIYLPLTGGVMGGSISWSALATNATLTLPVLTTAQRLVLTPVNGMFVYDSDLGEAMRYEGGWTSFAGGSGGGVTLTQVTNVVTNYVLQLGYVTASVTNGLASTNWVTNWVASQMFATAAQLAAQSNNMVAYITSQTNSVVSYILGIGYVTTTVTNGLASQTYVTSQGYVTAAVTNGLAGQNYVQSQTNLLNNYILSLNYSTQTYAQNLTNGYLTTAAAALIYQMSTVTLAQLATNDAKSLTNINAGKLASGTIPTSRYGSEILTNGFVGVVTLNNVNNALAGTLSGAIGQVFDGGETFTGNFTNYGGTATGFTGGILTMISFTNVNKNFGFDGVTTTSPQFVGGGSGLTGLTFPWASASSNALYASQSPYYGGSSSLPTFSPQFQSGGGATNLSPALSISSLTASNSIAATNIGTTALGVGTNKAGMGSQGGSDFTIYDSSGNVFEKNTNGQTVFQTLSNAASLVILASPAPIGTGGLVFAISNAGSQNLIFGITSNGLVMVNGGSAKSLPVISGAVTAGHLTMFSAAAQLADSGISSTVPTFTNASTYGTFTNFSVLGFKTNNPFLPGTVAGGAGSTWSNLTTAGFGYMAQGSIRVSGTMSATLPTGYAIIATFNDGTKETNDFGATAVAGLTDTFTNTIQIPENDTNTIIMFTNTGGTTLTILGSTMKAAR